MRQLLLFASLAFFLSSCVKQEPIPQQALTGIWKLNGYASTTYKIEFTNDGYVYWWNYRDWFNQVREFEVEYQASRNTVYLYRPGSRTVVEQFRVYRQRDGQLWFSVPSFGTDPDGNPTTGTDTYYQMR
jgi:hypothetical protein